MTDTRTATPLIVSLVGDCLSELNTIVWELNRSSQPWNKRLDAVPEWVRIQGLHRPHGVRWTNIDGVVKPRAERLHHYGELGGRLYDMAPSETDWGLSLSFMMPYEETPLILGYATSASRAASVCLNPNHPRGAEPWWLSRVEDATRMWEFVIDLDLDGELMHARTSSSVNAALEEGVSVEEYIETISGVVDSPIHDAHQLLETMFPEWVCALLIDPRRDR